MSDLNKTSETLPFLVDARDSIIAEALGWTPVEIEGFLATCNYKGERPPTHNYRTRKLKYEIRTPRYGRVRHIIPGEDCYIVRGLVNKTDFEVK